LTATILLRAVARKILDFVLPRADRCRNSLSLAALTMQKVRGTVQLSNGTRLEYVAVSLVKRPRGVRAGTGWGGVLRSTDNVPIDILREHQLVLENGSSGVINVLHISPTAEGSLALFHGVGASHESDHGEGFPPLEAA
jgi:hypothetical protein